MEINVADTLKKQICNPAWNGIPKMALDIIEKSKSKTINLSEQSQPSKSLLKMWQIRKASKIYNAEMVAGVDETISALSNYNGNAYVSTISIDKLTLGFYFSEEINLIGIIIISPHTMLSSSA